MLREASVRHFYAVMIQKVQRGVASRRNRLDFRVRKAYIMQLARKGEELRQILTERLLQQQLVRTSFRHTLDGFWLLMVDWRWSC